jgi:hypothetical protein
MTMSRDLGEHTGQVGVAEAEKPARRHLAGPDREQRHQG